MLECNERYRSLFFERRKANQVLTTISTKVSPLDERCFFHEKEGCGTKGESEALVAIRRGCDVCERVVFQFFFFFFFRNEYHQNTNETEDECHRVSDDLICDSVNQIQYIRPRPSLSCP